MKNEKDKVVPIIVNGELNDNAKRNGIYDTSKEKLPTKKYNFTDFLLTIIGLLLAVYGVYLFINKDDNKKNEENNSSNIVQKSNETKKEDRKEENIKVDYSTLLVMSEINEKRLYTTTDLEGLKTGLDIQNMSNNLKLVLASKISKKHTIDGQTYILKSDMDKSIKRIFGNINYEDSVFTYGNNTYTYNQETKRYYLFDSSSKYNLTYKRYDYLTQDEQDGTLIIKDFVAYTTLDNTKSTTLSNTPVASVINDINIKQETNKLKYYEYEFKVEDGVYHLKKITIK